MDHTLELKSATEALDDQIIAAAAYLSSLGSRDLSVDIDKDLISFCELGSFAEDEYPSIAFEDGELYLRIEKDDEIEDEPLLDVPIHMRIVVALSIPRLIAHGNTTVSKFANMATEEIARALDNSQPFSAN